MKKWLGSAACVVWIVGSGGCAGLLGLDDKLFGDGGGGAGGTTNAGGNPAGGSGGTGSTGGAGGTTSEGGGGAGGSEVLPLNDEFDFPLNGKESLDVLAERGWLFTWRPPGQEPYPEPVRDMFPYPGVSVESGQLVFETPETFYWFHQQKGVFMYKNLTGDFLVVADVEVEEGAAPGLPADEGAGAGLMVRHPDSAAHTEGNQRWMSIHRGARMAVPNVSASWSWTDGDGSAPAEGQQIFATGKVALCRTAAGVSLWSKDAETWKNRDDLLVGLSAGFALPDQVQVGLFVYAYNVDEGLENLPSPAGVKGVFKYVRQYEPGGSCDPGAHGE